MTWPSVDAPATAPSDHGEVRTQAYYAGGGDYFRSGYYAHGTFSTGGGGSTTLSAGTLLARPFWVPVARAFDRIGLHVSTAASAGGVLRMGVYATGGGLPGALLIDAGTVASTTTGGKEITISLSLDPGVYYLAVAAQVANCGVPTYTNDYHITPFSSSSTAPPSLAFVAYATRTSVTGALPSPWTASGTGGTSGTAPLVCLRAA